MIFPKATISDTDPILLPTYNLPGRESLRIGIAGSLIKASDAYSGERPFALLVGGGHGSGKSTVIKTLTEQGYFRGKKPVRIDIAEIQRLIPEFWEIRQRGDYRAADVVHNEAVIIAKICLNEAISGKRNIVYESTFSDRLTGSKLIKQLHENGYTVHLAGLTVLPETAIKRSEAKGRRSGEYIQSRITLTSHKKFSEAFDTLAKNADLVSLYQNNTHPTRIAIKEQRNEPIKVTNAVEYREFQGISERIKSLIKQRKESSAKIMATRRDRHLDNFRARKQGSSIRGHSHHHPNHTG